MTKGQGRKAHPSAPPADVVLDVAKIASDTRALDELGAAERQALELNEINRMCGRIDTAHFMETVSGRVMAETYLRVKALIGALGTIPVKTRTGERKLVSGMEEFCEAMMPVSARRCRQIIAAIDTLGTDLYEQAERLGLRARDYQALRALPGEEQEVVKRAIEAGDLATAVEIVHDLAARNGALKQKLVDASKDVAAKDRVIAKKSQQLDALIEAEERRRSRSGVELEQDQTARLDQDTTAAQLAIARFLVTACEVNASPATETASLRAAQAVDFISQLLAQGINAGGFLVNFEELVTPDWMKNHEAKG